MICVLDILQFALWTLTYGMIVFCGIRWRNPPIILMPLLSGTLNFAWEINTIVYQFEISEKLNLGCFVWVLLDVAIYIQNIRYLNCKNTKCRFIVLYILLLPIFGSVFYVLFRLPYLNGQLVTVFLIDFIMAAEFLICGRKIALHWKIPIALTKLLGDFFAWSYYMKNSTLVLIIGVVVFLLNLFYLAFCLEENAALSTKGKK